MNEDLIIEIKRKLILWGKTSRRIIGAVRSFLNYEKM